MTGFGVVRAEQGPAPAAFALSASQLRDGNTQSVHMVSSAQEGRLFWAPVNTYPDVLHHGSIDAELSLVNEGEQPATAYLEWYDLDGNSVGRYEQIVPLGEQVVTSLEEVFGQSPMRGTVRVFSDVDVAASLLEKTSTFTGRDIVTSIPMQTTPDSGLSSVVFSLFSNGEGQATEALLINTDRIHNSGSLAVMDKEGNTKSVILR